MIQSIFSGVSMFHIANATKTYTLDGGRHLDTSALLYLGLHVLSSQFVSPPPFALVGCTIFVSKILLTLAPIMAPTLYKSYEHTFSMLDTHLNTLLSYADPILFVAGLSTYVALIAMGNLVAGGVGLTVMALVFIKQNGYLPSWFDKGMFILSGPSLLHHGWTAPMHLIERILILTQACNFIAMCLLSLLNPKASLPSFYTPESALRALYSLGSLFFATLYRCTKLDLNKSDLNVANW